MLRLYRKRGPVLVGEVVLRPEPIEQIEPQVAPQRVLDDLAVTTTESGCADLDRAQDRLVQRHRRPNLRHLCIIASICSDAPTSFRSRRAAGSAILPSAFITR